MIQLLIGCDNLLLLIHVVLPTSGNLNVDKLKFPHKLVTVKNTRLIKNSRLTIESLEVPVIASVIA